MSPLTDQPAAQDIPPAQPGQSIGLPSKDNRTKKFGFLGIAKTFGIGAALLSGGGWLIHSYALPAASSVWQEMIRPRLDNLIIDELQRSPKIHDFMVTEINKYLAGDIPS